jgi:signal peptidase I
MLRSRIREFASRPLAAALVVAILLALKPGHAQAAADALLDIKNYNVASRSMQPTLLMRDYLLTFPRSKPVRGDLVAYRLPKSEDAVFIKRIIGLPGDQVQMVGGTLHINGEPVARERVEDFTLAGADGRPPRSGNGARRCRAVSAIAPSIWKKTARSTTPRPSPCPRVIISSLATIGTTRPTAACRARTVRCRPPISSAARNSSIFPSRKAKACGTSGAGRGRCDGIAYSRGCADLACHRYPAYR